LGIDEEAIDPILLDVEITAVSDGVISGSRRPGGVVVLHDLGDERIADDRVALREPRADSIPVRYVAAGYPVADFEHDPFRNWLRRSGGSGRVDCRGPIPGVISVARKLDQRLARRGVRQYGHRQGRAVSRLDSDVGAVGPKPGPRR